MKFIKIITTISWILFANMANADQNSNKNLITQIQKFLTEKYTQQEDNNLSPQDKINFEIKGIDSSSKIPNCENFTIKLNEEKISTQNTVVISCPSFSKSWKTYIPTRTTIKTPAIIVKDNIDKTEVLTQSNLEIIYKDKKRLRRSYFSNMQNVIGSKAKRNLRKGSILTRHNICMVCSKEPVIINAVKGGLNLQTSGVALGDGSIGDVIRVQNSKSKRIISATVSNIGEVEIKF